MKATFKALCILALLSASLSASAVTLINGISVHSELGQDSFIGALFTSNLSNNSKDILIAQEEKQLQVRILAKRISARRFKRMWIEGLAINASAAELQAQSQNMANFSNMLKVSLKQGDIFAVQRSNESVKVVINGSTLGEIEDVKFFDLLLRTWIGPVPLSSQFRAGLLTAGDLSPTLQQLFNDTRPSDQRIAAVANALATAATKTAPKDTARAPRVAVTPKNIPKIKAPTLIKPPVIKAAPAPKVTVAKPSAPKSQPAKVAPAPPTPKKPAVVKKVEVAKQAVEAEEDANESILEEDGEEFTAETLLDQQLYIAKLKKWTYKELLYPQRSLEKDEQGVVRLSVTIERDGSLDKLDVIEKPEYFRLTKAAVKAVRKSSPYPAMPDSMIGDKFTFTLPIVFRIVD